MGKIMKVITGENGFDTNFVAGTVSYVREGTGAAEGRVVDVGFVVQVYNSETKENEKQYINVSFWNDDKSPSADYIRKAKVDKGSFLMVRCSSLTEKDPAADGIRRFNATGYGFQYNSIWELNDGNYNLLVGTVRQFKEENDRVTVSIPVKDKNGDTKWYGVSFKNTENRKLADFAKKVLEDGKPVCLLCGKLNTSESKGKTYYNLAGFEIETGFMKEKTA